jgi:Holliday junction resolvase-like predicted endonuclease
MQEIEEPHSEIIERMFDRIGAVGEELTKYNLLARGWDVINLNLIGNNKPNADLLAVKGKTIVRLQVKTSRYRDWVQLGWITKGKTNINGKFGDPADFFVMIGHQAPNDCKIHVIPVDYMKAWEQRNMAAHLAHGRTKNSGYMYFGETPRKTKFDINKSGDEFRMFRNAWELLEAN